MPGPLSFAAAGRAQFMQYLGDGVGGAPLTKARHWASRLALEVFREEGRRLDRGTLLE